MTTWEHTHSRITLARATAALIVTAIASGLAATAPQASSQRAAAGLQVVTTTISTATRSWTYGWPLKPFDRQHPVRAFLDDPRIGARGSSAFHFGIDISAPDGTAVYAVEAGTVYIHSPEALAVVAPNRTCTFGYWHIVAAVKHHQVVEKHQLLGWIGKGWAHVHFAERRNGVYVNPLRPGGIGPYIDRTIPTVSRIAFVGGALIAVASDSPYPRVPGAWHDEPVTPALLRWRVAGSSVWHTAADFRSAMLPASRFGEIYTSATRQNHKGVPGSFCFYLARGAQARRLGNSLSSVEVEASDTAGNRVVVAVLLGV